MLEIAFFNGDYIRTSDMQLPGTDLGLHRGYGIFDFFKMRNRGNPWYSWYYERLCQSLQRSRMSIPYDKEALAHILDTLLTLNKVDDAYLKIVVTAGSSDNGYTRAYTENTMIFAMPLPHSDINSMDSGVLITDEYRRDIPLVKTTNYMRSCILQPEMQAAGAVDVLFHYEGEISEASRCNIFIVNNGSVSTPDRHILHGITRRRVLAIQNTGIPIVESKVLLEEVMCSEEVFITSSTKGIMPITAIDGMKIGDGTIGTITQELMQHINYF